MSREFLLKTAAAIDQTAWIQSISETGAPGVPLQVTLGVSPV